MTPPAPESRDPEEGALFFPGTITEAVSQATNQALPFLCLVVVAAVGAGNNDQDDAAARHAVVQWYLGQHPDWQQEHQQQPTDLVLISLVHGSPEYGLFAMVYPPCSRTSLYVIVEGAVRDVVPLDIMAGTGSSLDGARVAKALGWSSSSPPPPPPPPTASNVAPVGRAERDPSGKGATSKDTAPDGTFGSGSSGITHICRLALRLPDGVQLRHTFAASDTLACVRAHLMAQASSSSSSSLRGRSFTLAKFHPSQLTPFTEEQEQETLEALGLTPSYSLVIILLPTGSGPAVAPSQPAASSTTTSITQQNTTLARGPSPAMSEFDSTRSAATSVLSTDPSSSMASGDAGERCWLALRLFDGRILRHPFPAHPTTLATVRAFITPHNGSGAFSLLEPPGRPFTTREEEEVSLRDLGLTPSASLTLVPVAGRVSTAYASAGALQRGAWRALSPSAWAQALGRWTVVRVLALFVSCLLLPLLHGGTPPAPEPSASTTGGGPGKRWVGRWYRGGPRASHTYSLCSSPRPLVRSHHTAAARNAGPPKDRAPAYNGNGTAQL